MLGLILEGVKFLTAGIIDTVKQKREIKAAAAENRARLLRDKETNNHEWEMAQIEDKDLWLRRISFGILSFPIVFAWVDPTNVALYFNVALAAIPEWYQKMYVGIIGAIWGLAELKRFKK